jgi:hypothetical protein
VICTEIGRVAQLVCMCRFGCCRRGARPVVKATKSQDICQVVVTPCQDRRGHQGRQLSLLGVSLWRLTYGQINRLIRREGVVDNEESGPIAKVSDLRGKPSTKYLSTKAGACLYEGLIILIVVKRIGNHTAARGM